MVIAETFVPEPEPGMTFLQAVMETECAYDFYGAKLWNVYLTSLNIQEQFLNSQIEASESMARSKDHPFWKAMLANYRTKLMNLSRLRLEALDVKGLLTAISTFDSPNSKSATDFLYALIEKVDRSYQAVRRASEEGKQNADYHFRKDVFRLNIMQGLTGR